jgi:hypothetical protein
MTKALADLIVELQEDVPPVDGVPSDAQYERAIKEAVAEFSRRCGLTKNSTIAIVSGTATYTLPDDFLKLIEIENPYSNEHHVIITATGIIPFSELSPFEEEITIRDKTMTIFPTPAYSMARFLEYKAAWALAEDDSYPLTEDEAQIVLLKAKQLCFDKLANASASSGFKYTVGNMSVDKSGVSDGYSKRIYELAGEFVQACDRYNGTAMFTS